MGTAIIRPLATVIALCVSAAAGQAQTEWTSIGPPAAAAEAGSWCTQAARSSCGEGGAGGL